MMALYATPATLDIRQDGSAHGLCRGPPQPTTISQLPCPITTTINTTTLPATHFNYQLQDIFNRRYGGSYHIPQQRGRKIPHFFVSFCLPSGSSLLMSSPPEMTFRNNSAAFTCRSTTGINANLPRPPPLPIHLPTYTFRLPDCLAALFKFIRTRTRLPHTRPTD